ncbi:uncharacterized protein BDZ83DRAFT_654962 [Colletotrichum acutatum]|uniref:Uncharacterized protein n=1 Tax=Glomerella acutata TaxID=27357 RepID=A0AAD8XCG1_GLOAC|nr:uncharacterized protein BDZ83DRAFT_654962 [Colletotrichum acutatum]KAK1718756.1 hypothetical protein BDZ83DRAFT_654962 [Colletotrichum acutatum]
MAQCTFALLRRIIIDASVKWHGPQIPFASSNAGDKVIKAEEKPELGLSDGLWHEAGAKDGSGLSADGGDEEVISKQERLAVRLVRPDDWGRTTGYAIVVNGTPWEEYSEAGSRFGTTTPSVGWESVSVPVSLLTILSEKAFEKLVV